MFLASLVFLPEKKNVLCLEIGQRHFLSRFSNFPFLQLHFRHYFTDTVDVPLHSSVTFNPSNSTVNSISQSKISY